MAEPNYSTDFGSEDIEILRKALGSTPDKEAVRALIRVTTALSNRIKLFQACSSALKWLENMRIIRGGERHRLQLELRSALER